MKVSAINTTSYVCKPNMYKHQSTHQSNMINVQNQPSFHGKWNALLGGIAGGLTGFLLGGPLGAIGGAVLGGGVCGVQEDKGEMDEYTRTRISHYD